VPVNAGRGDPVNDADGSGRAWLTDNSSANGGNSDVDGGQTILTSPVFDASAGGIFRYSYWLNDTSGGEIGAEDFIRVEVSTNAGATWTTARSVSIAAPAWRQDTLTIAQGADAAPSAQFRVRFIAADNTPGDVLEAGVDAMSFISFLCDADPTCNNPADANGDGLISPTDFSAWVSAFNAQAPACDQNADGTCTPADFSAWVSNFNAGCP
jgi:hypothetical protein